MSLEERISAIRERIARCAEHTGRKGSDVRLVGVTKTRTVAEMREAAPLIDAIGENRVQEALSKKQEWGGEFFFRRARSSIVLFSSRSIIS